MLIPIVTLNKEGYNESRETEDIKMSEKKEFWEGKHYAFFQNRECEFFPCHETENPEDFNCLFCYCPLYALGSRCGGNYSYRPGEAKDCSNCKLPHSRAAYGYIIGKFPEIMKVAEGNMQEPQEESEVEQ